MQAIHRRQQFWGELYYHTTHDVAAVQPTEQSASDSGAPEWHQVGYQVDMQPMQWLIDRFTKQLPFSSVPVFQDSASMPNQCLINEYTRNQVRSPNYCRAVALHLHYIEICGPQQAERMCFPGCWIFRACLARNSIACSQI